jgi:predicted transposase/invertase (TIGR01784 family)
LHISFLQLRKEALAGQENLAHWLSFFRGRLPVDNVPGYIRQAYQTVAYANLTEREREMIDYEEMSREDAKAQLLYARDEGVAQGFERGIEQGFMQGRNEESARVVRAALQKGLDISIIRDITGLDTEAIRRLQEN